MLVNAGQKMVQMSEHELPDKWDPNYRPGIYQMMLDQSKTFKCAPQEIVFLGDSFTFWGNWPERLRNLVYKNRGVPGDITFGVLNRLDPIIDSFPQKIFILIGVNDIARNIPDAVILENYSTILQRIKTKTPRTTIIVQSVLPTNPYMPTLADYKTKKNHILAVNAGIEQLAHEAGATYLDLFQHFADKEGYLPEKYTWDGLHLTELAYQKWTDILITGGYIGGK